MLEIVDNEVVRHSYRNGTAQSQYIEHMHCTLALEENLTVMRKFRRALKKMRLRDHVNGEAR